MRTAALALVLSMLAAGAFPAAGTSGPRATEETREFPMGFSHRPLMEFFTSLSCPPCMADGEPATTQLWNEWGYGGGYPYNMVVFHHTNGGNGDDPFVIDEGWERYDEMHVVGTPDNYVDAGYRHPSSSYESAKSAVEDSGQRTGNIQSSFKLAKIDVQQVFNGHGFDINVQVTYLGQEGGRIRDMLRSSLAGTLNVYMVEDNVSAFSSELGENVSCHNVFRGFAAHNVPVDLSNGESFQGAYTWEIPTLATHNDLGVPIPPVEPSRINAVAAIFDTDDTSSGGSDGKPGTPRAINSATPATTAYDSQNAAPTIENATGTYANGKASISAQMDDPDSIFKAFLVYNLKASNYTGNWTVIEMNVTGEGPYTATGEAEVKEGKKVYYKIMAFDGNWTEAKTNVAEYKAVPSGGLSGGGGGIGAGAIVVLLLIVAAGGFLFMRSKGMLPQGKKPAPRVEVVDEEGLEQGEEGSEQEDEMPGREEDESPKEDDK